MTTDYQGNSKKHKEKKEKPEKDIQKVVANTVVVQKKPLGTKFKDLFIEADFKSVVFSVVTNVVIPEIKNMIVDAAHQGMQNLIYGSVNARYRRPAGGGPASRMMYNSPVSRVSYQEPRNAPPISVSPRSRAIQEEFLISSREDAEEVLQKLSELLDGYDVVTVGDLYGILGQSSTPVDEKWGWSSLDNIGIKQVRDGFLLVLPNAEVISN